MLTADEYKAIADRIIDVVGEHTSHWVVIAKVPKEDAAGRSEIHTIALWHGDIDTAIGMCDRGKMRMLELARRHDFGEPPRGDLEKH